MCAIPTLYANRIYERDRSSAPICRADMLRTLTRRPLNNGAGGCGSTGEVLAMADPQPVAAAVDDVDLEVWGDNVRYWRVERGLTQAQLSSRLAVAGVAGATQSAISDIEQGRRRPSDQQRIGIARVLDVPAPQLFPLPRDVR